MVIGKVDFHNAHLNAAPPPPGETRPTVYTVKKGETLTQIAKKYGLTVKQFKKWTGLKSDNLSVGQEINLPQAPVPQGKGPFTLMNSYNMDKELFCAMNGIDPKKLSSYQAQAGETFYVCKNLKKETSPTAPASSTTPSTPTQSSTSSSTRSGSSKVTLNNGKTFTLQDLRNDAIRSAKADKGFAGCDVSSIDRPLPNVENGKIVATAEINKPIATNDKTLKGKVIILNPGHGGYAQDNGFFDAGAVSGRPDAAGKKVPIQEWKLARRYADELSKKLQEKGATVIIVQGAVRHGGMCAQSYLENLLAGKKGSDEIKQLMKSTSKSNMLFMSIHFDDPGSSKIKNCSVNAQKRNGVVDQGDRNFAQNIQNEIRAGLTILTPEISERDLYVNRAMGSTIPSVLLEVGNIKNTDIQNTALSSSDINKYTDCLVRAIVKTMVK